MKIKTAVALLLMLSVAQPLKVAAQSKIDETSTLPSKILNSDRKFSIYLPDGYDRDNRSYPVLYLLHGMGDDHTGWVQYGEVQRIADKAIADGSSAPMIIVMPDASGLKVGYFNAVDGKSNYEDFFIKEFIPFIEKNYRCRSEKQYRAIAGLSLGGGASLVYALHHPELFSSCSPLSAAIFTFTHSKSLRESYAKENVSEKVMSDWVDKNDILKLVNEMPDSLKHSVRWSIDIGDDDFLFEGNSMLHIIMRKNNIPHEFRIRDGAHTWSYWRSALPNVLTFATQIFHRF